VHVLKHSIITELIRAGVPLQHVQVFTGHKNINSLLRYMTPSAAEVDKEVGEAFVKMF
jgi:site-specific recombinase XerD